MDLINILADTTCGNLGFQFDEVLPNITSTIVTVLKIGVPILLIIFGMLDLGKAVMAQKDDEIKKGQQTFMKRCIAAVIVFFIVAIVQLLVGIVAGDDNAGISGCIDCFINNNCGQ